MSVTRYCEAEDVQAYFGAVNFTQNTALNSTKINRLIEDASSYMEGSLRVSYSLPITNETDLRILKGICARLVAGEVDDILNPVANNGTHKTRNLKQEGKTMLKEFCERSALLSAPESRISCVVDETRESGKEY